MKKVISASRRSDLVACFPEWLFQVLREEKVRVYGPSGHVYSVNISPETVHTLVLWSKDFRNLIENRYRLKECVNKYDQLYLHFTITGLGGTRIEKGVPLPEKAVSQLDFLIKISGGGERISVRFDPIVYWKSRGKVMTNLYYFETLAPELNKRGIRAVRVSFTQWYGKAKRRALKHEFSYVDPSFSEKRRDARYLADIAKEFNLQLFACSQSFFSAEAHIRPSSCIDGVLLRRLHPAHEPVSSKKDKSQRAECCCTESIDIGSYLQFCPNSCLYCYANPKME